MGVAGGHISREMVFQKHHYSQVYSQSLLTGVAVIYLCLGCLNLANRGSQKGYTSAFTQIRVTIEYQALRCPTIGYDCHQSHVMCAVDRKQVGAWYFAVLHINNTHLLDMGEEGFRSPTLPSSYKT